jgi:hypothetical protein
MDVDDNLYELWHVFFNKRLAHLDERSALSRALDMVLMVGTMLRQQHTIQAERRATRLLVDVEGVQQRIRASLHGR